MTHSQVSVTAQSALGSSEYLVVICERFLVVFVILRITCMGCLNKLTDSIHLLQLNHLLLGSSGRILHIEIAYQIKWCILDIDSRLLLKMPSLPSDKSL